MSSLTSILLIGGLGSGTNRIASAKWNKGELPGGKPKTLEELKREIQNTFVVVPLECLGKSFGSEPSRL